MKFLKSIVLFVVLFVLLVSSTMAQGPGETRYIVVDTGISVISGDGVNYYVEDGYVDLPSGVDWVQSLITKGILQAVYTTFEVNGDVTLSPQTAIMVTQDSTISPTGSYQPLTAENDVSTSSITAGSAGDVLYLTNTVTWTITLTDTGALKLSGNAALGQYDTLLLIADGTNWIEVVQTDN